MFWDNVSPVYDFFEVIYNHRVYLGTGKAVAAHISASDIVLECACGTGAISQYIAPKCRMLIATDLSKGMLRQAAQKCAKFENAKFRYADLMHLKCRDGRFDKVVAGNVIHLLDDPELAVRELLRVCKPAGKLIIPTYINDEGTQQRKTVMQLEKLGVQFKREFDFRSYQKYFWDIGFQDAEFEVVKGRMPCAIAVITKAI